VVFVDQGVTVGEHRLDALPAAATRTWRLRALELAPLLKALKGNDHDEPTAAGVDVRLPSDEAAADLLATLVGKGVRVVSCQPVGGQLEATYLELTQ
jgi:ABC-2 type transport system ATP-binding protein